MSNPDRNPNPYTFRRLLKDKIIALKKELGGVRKHRDFQRRSRRKLGLPVIALVGYTNAGKSTLLNTLTRAGVMAENMLFATLDPTTRKVKLTGLKVLCSVALCCFPPFWFSTPGVWYRISRPNSKRLFSPHALSCIVKEGQCLLFFFCFLGEVYVPLCKYFMSRKTCTEL